MGKIEKIYICTKKEGYHYLFTCKSCDKKYELITGGGRYGNLGEFSCPNCKEEYYATIDDFSDPCLYVYVVNNGEQPDPLLDREARKRKARLEYDGLGYY